MESCLKARFQIRNHFLIIDELHGCQALRVKYTGKFLDCGRFGVDLISLGIPKGEDVGEAGRVVLLLPDLIAQGAGLIGPHIGNELVDRSKNPLERFRSHLIMGKLPDLRVFRLWI